MATALIKLGRAAGFENLGDQPQSGGAALWAESSAASHLRCERAACRCQGSGRSVKHRCASWGTLPGLGSGPVEPVVVTGGTTGVGAAAVADGR